MIKKTSFNQSNQFKQGQVSADESLLIYLYFLKFGNNKENIMFDVGAFVGSSFQYFLDSNWEIHAFEVDKVYFKNLKNKYGNKVVLNNLAVDITSNKKVNLYESEVSKGITSLIPFHPSHRPSGYEVNTINLSDYTKTHHIEHIEFLKIDIEGNDYNALLGSNWEKIVPEVLLVEFELNKTLSLGHTPDDIAKFLISKNYTVYVFEWYPIIQYGTEHSLKDFYKYQVNKIPDNSWGNFIAFQNDPGIQLIKMLFKESQIYINNENKKRKRKNNKYKIIEIIRKYTPKKFKNLVKKVFKILS